ncbi:MAG: GNAT family N-acetyltransferase [Bacteroidales bacterium]|nr:GNAT family N-acetyltransferase [Bacteroidales bacterium]MDD3522712.1 GNAT family N-acetyltransferase [Bacteroidales bacterium]MDD4030057.1 GNAT family N-acetyltransferase [Bacteroidales bacterium]MDD4436070.1 GNAT family N-acetyltransferase [Bacteroidales bacterium]MDD5732592.1 GNAT family N-acetyltransferase [Bacteroidales bacterium]
MKVDFPIITTGEQIARLCQMASLIWREAYRDMLPREQIHYMLDLFFKPSVIEKQIAGENYTYCFINTGGVDAGFFGICPRLEGNALFLSKIYLMCEYRGSGLFDQTTHEIVRLARLHGLPAVRLHVNKNNTRAIKAYIRFGFNIVESDVFTIGGGYVMDDHILEYVIRE